MDGCNGSRRKMLQQVDRTNFSHRRLHIFQRHNQVHVHLSLNVGAKANSLLHVLQYLQSYQIVSQTVYPIIANCFLLSSCTRIGVLASLIDQQQHRLLQLSMASLWSERCFFIIFPVAWVSSYCDNKHCSFFLHPIKHVIDAKREKRWMDRELRSLNIVAQIFVSYGYFWKEYYRI